MEKRTTKRDYLNKLLKVEEVANNQELVDFINHEIKLLDKKSASRVSANNAKAQENAEIKKAIIKALIEVDKAVTITDLQKSVEEMAEYSNQRLSALLNQMYKAGEVDKIIDKKKSYFKAID